MELHHVHPHLPQVECHELAANHAGRGLLAHAEVGVEAGEVGVAETVIILKGGNWPSLEKFGKYLIRYPSNLSLKSV